VPEKDEIKETIKKGDMDELLRLIKEGDFSTKNRILESLKEMNPEEAVDILIDLLKDQSIAFKAAYMLGEIGTKRATKPLISLLKSKDKIIRGNTIDALAKIGDHRAVKPIMEMLKDEPWIQNRAVEALVQFQEKAIDDILKEFEKSKKPNPLLFYVLEQLKDKPVPSLIKALESENENLRANAAYALRCIGTSFLSDEKTNKKLMEAVPSLVKMLNDPSEFVRGNAALALGGLKETGIRDKLVALLKDKDPYPRAMASFALGVIGDEGAVDKLIELLNDPSSEVKKSAVVSLGKLKAKKAVKKILPFVKAEEKPLRLAAIRALRMIADPSSAEKIAEALRDEDDDVRIEALRAIKELNYPKTLEKILEALKDENAEVRKIAVGLLGRIGGEDVVQPLIDALRDKNESVAKSAVRAMRELKYDSFIKPLIDALKKNKDYNYDILRAVKEIGTRKDFKEAVKKAIKIGEYDLLTGRLVSRMDRIILGSIVELLGSRSKKMQINALTTLQNFEKKIKDEETIKKVVEKLTAADQEIVKKAAEVVKKIGVPAAVPLANIMEKTSKETKVLLKKVFSDMQGLNILESMEKALKEPAETAKSVTKEGLTLFERLIGMVEGALTESAKEISKIVKESEEDLKKGIEKSRKKRTL